MVLPASSGFAQEISGDFNGDLFDDLAVGVSGENVGAVVDAGAVNVLYGSGTGLQASGVGGPNDQFWSQDSVGVLDLAEGSDACGNALAVGDFNNDGFDDLAVGCPFENVGAVSDAGAVFVLYGSATGLQASGVGGPNDQFWHQDSTSVNDLAEAFDNFGWALAADDFNNDGFDDLAIGVRTEDIGALGSAGAVNVLYGSGTGLQATGVGGPNDQFWHQDVASVSGVAEAGDSCGWALATGHFDSDGFADLAFGCPFENVTATDDGTANVLYGSATGLQATGVGGPNDQLWHQDIVGVLDLAEDFDWLGASLAAGDFNNDGFDDLVLGAPGETVGAISGAGATNVVYGAAAGLQASGVGGPNDQFWHQDSTSVAETAESFDEFGCTLVTGDFNNDSFADLAVGVEREALLAFGFDNGVVHVIHGSATGLQATGVGGPDDQLWHQDVASVTDLVENDDSFGHSLTTADFNNDGFSDLASGAFAEDVGAVSDAGAANVLYGSATGLQATGVGGPNDQFWHQDSVGVLDLAEMDDFFADGLVGGAPCTVEPIGVGEP